MTKMTDACGLIDEIQICSDLITSDVEINRNSGTFPYQSHEPENETASSLIFLPNPDWGRVPSVSTVSPATANNLFDGSSIVVTKISDWILESFHRAYLDLLSRPKSAVHPAIACRELSGVILDVIASELCHCFACPFPPVYKQTINFSMRHCLSGADIALRTSATSDSRGSSGVRGLHVDNWEEPRLPLLQRSHAGVKYIINLGTEDRGFVFLNSGIEDLARTLSPQIPSAISSHAYASPFAEWFLRSFPSSPITRITLRPGMGVIAPVQNLIHDGILNQKVQPDIVGLISFRHLTPANPD